MFIEFILRKVNRFIYLDACLKHDSLNLIYIYLYIIENHNKATL
jgi:hypothetical protein